VSIWVALGMVAAILGILLFTIWASEPLGAIDVTTYRLFVPQITSDGIDAQDGADHGAAEGCPEIDPNAEVHTIYDHRVQRATSSDGVKFVDDETILLEHASVPDAVVRPNGETWVYFVNGEAGQHGVFIAKQDEDGLLHTFDCVRIDDKFNGNAVDPDVVLLDDGRYRLFYYEGWFVGQKPPPGSEPAHPIFQAISNDGVHFTVESKILEVEDGGTDPTCVELDDGSWLLALAHKSKTLLATSEDGQTYTLSNTELPHGIPELHHFDDGSVRLYLAGKDGMKIWLSTDNGDTWTDEGNASLNGADPSLVKQADGTYVMYRKTFVPGSQQPPQ